MLRMTTSLCYSITLTQNGYTFSIILAQLDGIIVCDDCCHVYSAMTTSLALPQFELMSKVDMDAAITFRRELGLTYNVTAFTSPTIELFRVPVASVTGLPPVYLTVTYQVQTLITVQAYSGGEADLRTAFNTSGYLLVGETCWIFDTSDTWRHLHHPLSSHTRRFSLAACLTW